MTDPFIKHARRGGIPSIGIFLFVAAILFSGCGQKEIEGHEHGYDTESPSGASFKVGNGVSVTDEARKILDLKVAAVAEEILSHEIQFVVQVYDATQRSATDVSHKTAQAQLASGLVAPAQAALVRVGMSVKLTNPSGVPVEGTVKAIHLALASGDAEIEMSIPSDAAFKSGDFVRGTITLLRSSAVMVIPYSALLHNTEGTFVYAVNGSAYRRTAVKIGSTSVDRVEITDGLFAGDQVVATPVQTLWLIELRAVKGGGHSH